jgi:hypothetical protein
MEALNKPLIVQKQGEEALEKSQCRLHLAVHGHGWTIWSSRKI